MNQVSTSAPVQAADIPEVPARGVRAIVASLVIPRLLGADPALVVARPQALYRRVGSRGLIGFGESYQAGDWDHPDLAGFLTRIAERLDSRIPPFVRALRRYLSPDRPRSEMNTLAGARENIHRHYDLSNDMFALFLDETMTYSSALFEEDANGVPVASAELLAAAQLRKVDRLLDAAGVGPGSSVLEIGTGWGTLAIQAAKRGARVRTITISDEQRNLAERRIAAAGVAELVDVDLCDYREVSLPPGGRGYDAVVSVEMIEAVGERYWPAYFSTIDRLLAPGGRVGLQAITTRPDRLRAARHSHSWMNEYIFPGGLVPSVESIETTLRGHTRLGISGSHSFGAHYAATLRVWRERFAQRASEVERLGFDEVFRRTWNMYFALCEAGFRSGYLNVYQFVLER